MILSTMSLSKSCRGVQDYSHTNRNRQIIQNQKYLWLRVHTKLQPNLTGYALSHIDCKTLNNRFLNKLSGLKKKIVQITKSMKPPFYVKGEHFNFSPKINPCNQPPKYGLFTGVEYNASPTVKSPHDRCMHIECLRHVNPNAPPILSQIPYLGSTPELCYVLKLDPVPSIQAQGVSINKEDPVSTINFPHPPTQEKCILGNASINKNDRVITKQFLQSFLSPHQVQTYPFVHLILLVPYDQEEMSEWPFMTLEAIEFLKTCFPHMQHFSTNLPSVDRKDSNYKTENHQAFFKQVTSISELLPNELFKILPKDQHVTYLQRHLNYNHQDIDSIGVESFTIYVH